MHGFCVPSNDAYDRSPGAVCGGFRYLQAETATDGQYHFQARAAEKTFDTGDPGLWEEVKAFVDKHRPVNYAELESCTGDLLPGGASAYKPYNASMRFTAQMPYDHFVARD